MRGRVKTIVPRARSTLDSHLEVKERATQVFPASGGHKVTSHILAALRRDSVNFSRTTRRVHTMAASHGLFEKDGAFRFHVDTCQVNG